MPDTRTVLEQASRTPSVRRLPPSTCPVEAVRRSVADARGLEARRSPSKRPRSHAFRYRVSHLVSANVPPCRHGERTKGFRPRRNLPSQTQCRQPSPPAGSQAAPDSFPRQGDRHSSGRGCLHSSGTPALTWEHPLRLPLGIPFSRRGCAGSGLHVAKEPQSRERFGLFLHQSLRETDIFTTILPLQWVCILTAPYAWLLPTTQGHSFKPRGTWRNGRPHFDVRTIHARFNAGHLMRYSLQ